MGKKKTDYSKWSTAQLEKQHKTLKFATGLLAGLLIVLLLATIYISYRDKQLNPLLITPIALSVIIPLNFKRLKDIREEIERRNVQ